MSVYGKRSSGKVGARRWWRCLPWLVFLFICGAVISLLQTMSTGPLSRVRTTDANNIVPCPPANLSVAVTSTVINRFIAAAVIPKIQEDNNTLVIPEQEVDHVWVGEMVLQHFKLKSLTVNTALPDEQSLVLQSKGFAMEVEKSRFIFHYMGIRCDGTFWVTLNETDAEAVLRLTLLPDGRWSATFPHLEVDWGQLVVYHQLDSKACGIAQKVLEIFIGDFDAFVVSQIKKKLDEEAPSKAAESLNGVFAKIGIRAMTPPVMTADTLRVMLDLNPVDFGCAPALTASAMPDLISRDIAIRTTLTSVNNLLYNAAQAGRLRVEHDLPAEWNTSLFKDIIPELYQACRECYLYTDVQAAKAPVLDVPQDGEVLVVAKDLILGLYVHPKSMWQVATLSDIVTKKKSGSCAGSAAVSRSFDIKKTSSWRTRKPLPVLAIRLSAACGVRNISAETGRSISYELLPVENVSVQIEASNIGDVNATELEKAIAKAWNDFAAPLANSESPLRLPPFFQKAILEVGLAAIQGGVDADRETEFMQGVFSKL
ncbi:hypothetical protein Q4I30_003383 [Leishmania utingensis]|uniref:Expression site-associated protein 5 (ESAG5) n=1 Tax=Leishmania utingensis TaxID=653362 RepID=A0AAW3AMM1_9TRYP